MTNEKKVLFVKKVQCLDDVERSFAFNAGAVIYLQNYYADKQPTKKEREDYILFSDFDWGNITKPETLRTFFYAMGLTDAEDRGEIDWSEKKVDSVLDFSNIITLKLLLDSAIIASMPATEEAKKKMTKKQVEILEQATKKHLLAQKAKKNPIRKKKVKK